MAGSSCLFGNRGITTKLVPLLAEGKQPTEESGNIGKTALHVTLMPPEGPVYAGFPGAFYILGYIFTGTGTEGKSVTMVSKAPLRISGLLISKLFTGGQYHKAFGSPLAVYPAAWH